MEERRREIGGERVESQTKYRCLEYDQQLIEILSTASKRILQMDSFSRHYSLQSYAFINVAEFAAE